MFEHLTTIVAFVPEATKLSVINLDNFSEIDINSVDSNNLSKELKESLFLFHYIIKQEIGEI